jgi:hypothetical protein
MAVEGHELPPGARIDPRRAIRTADTPPEIAAIFEDALDALIDSDEPAAD